MKTILIVDDIKVNLKVLEVLLTRNGYAVLTAMSAGKALVLLQEHRCDLIISDIHMPEMDGFQFCRLCQLDEKLRQIPFVFYSSTQTANKIREQARKVGACALVKKPADPARLLKTIDTVLAKQSSRIPHPTGRTVGPRPCQKPSGGVSNHVPDPADPERFCGPLLKNLPGIVWTLDTGGEFSYISPAVDRLTGFSVSRIQQMGKSGWLDRVHPSDEQAVRTAFKKLFQDRVPLDILYRFQCLDNRFIWMHESSGVPYDNAADGVCRVDGVTTDISARMRDLDRRMATMEQDVIHTFSQGISHDLDNLLTGIADYIELSASVSGRFRDGDRFLANALKISRSALALNRDISFLSGQQTPVEKNSLFTRVVARVARSLLDGSDVQYRVNMPRGLWPCRVDTRLMARALEAVLVNACEAVAHKTDRLIDVTLKNLVIDENGPVEAPGILDIHLRPGRYVQAVIRDNGSGIDEPSLHRIFYPYFSLKPRDMKKGVGLGLAICRVIVLRHGGGMAVESRKNHGTKMKIILPAETEETGYENRFDRG
jgi:CheY-like chemotaxis protein/signal transduction histidine kinase